MKILLVEDNVEIGEYLKSALKAECYEVDYVKNGEEGLHLAQVVEYDLIILDLNLPEISGEEICQTIRKEKNNVPVLILSVESRTNRKADLLNWGADDYLTKPFSLEELLARLKALLRRPKKIEDDVISLGGLEIDVAKNKVIKSGKEVSLTGKEFAILVYLARKPGVVISRNKILEQVWDSEVDVFSNAVDVHIYNLRKKIGGKNSRGKNQIIYTIPGRGYKLEV